MSLDGGFLSSGSWVSEKSLDDEWGHWVNVIMLYWAAVLY